MRNINRVVISGNLTRDPEWRGSGQSALALGVAVNDERKNPETGEWVEYPNYIDCVVFGNRASAIERFLERGTKVTVEGRLRQSRWEAKDGTKRSRVEVVVDEIEFSNRKGDAPQKPQQIQPQPTYVQPQPVAPTYQAGVAPKADVYDDEIPF